MEDRNENKSENQVSPHPPNDRIFILIITEFTNNLKYGFIPPWKQNISSKSYPLKKYPDPCMLNTCMVQCTLKCRITICLSYVSSRRSLLKRPKVLVVHLRNIARCFPSPNCKKTKKVYLKSIYQSII